VPLVLLFEPEGRVGGRAPNEGRIFERSDESLTLYSTRRKTRIAPLSEEQNKRLSFKPSVSRLKLYGIACQPERYIFTVSLISKSNVSSTCIPASTGSN